MTCSIVPDFCRPAFGDFPAEIQHADPVTNVHDHTHVVFDQDNGHPPFLIDVQDKTGHILRFFQVHTGGRFVEQEEVWASWPGPGPVPPVSAARKAGCGRPVCGWAQSPGGRRSSPRSLSARPFFPAGLSIIDPAGEKTRLQMDMAPKFNVVQDGHVPEKFHILKGPGNAQFGDLMGLNLGDLFPSKMIFPVPG